MDEVGEGIEIAKFEKRGIFLIETGGGPMKNILLIIAHSCATALAFVFGVVIVGGWRWFSEASDFEINDGKLWYVLACYILLMAAYLWRVIKVYPTPAMLFASALFCIMMILSVLSDTYLPESDWFIAALAIPMLSGILIHWLQQQRDKDSFKAFFKPRKAA